MSETWLWRLFCICRYTENRPGLPYGSYLGMIMVSECRLVDKSSLGRYAFRVVVAKPACSIMLPPCTFDPITLYLLDKQLHAIAWTLEHT